MTPIFITQKLHKSFSGIFLKTVFNYGILLYMKWRIYKDDESRENYKTKRNPIF